MFSPALALHLSLSVLCVRSFVFVPPGSPQAPQSAGRLIIKLACACADVPLTRTSSLGAICREARYSSITSTLQSVDHLGRPYLDFVVPPGKESLFPRVAVGHRSGIPGRVVGVDTVCPAPSLCARLLCFPSLQCLFGVRIKRKHWAQN